MPIEEGSTLQNMSAEEAFSLLIVQFREFQQKFENMQAQYTDVQAQLSHQDVLLQQSLHVPPVTREEHQSPRPISTSASPGNPVTGLPLGFKPAKPDTFTGKRGESLDSWLFQVEQYMDLCQLQQATRVQYTTTLLKDNAMVWW